MAVVFSLGRKTINKSVFFLFGHQFCYKKEMWNRRKNNGERSIVR